MTVRFIEATGELVVAMRFGDTRKDEVKALGPKFNFDAKTWHFRADVDDATVARLTELGFVIPDGWRARKSGGPVDSASLSGALAETIVVAAPVRGKTVTELAGELRGLVYRAFPETVWVRGIAIVRSAPNPNFFFSLAEHDGAGKPVAEMGAIIWGSDIARITAPLVAAGLELVNGLKVCVRAKVSFNAKSGRVDLHVEEFDATASLGEIMLQREKVIRALTAEGLDRLAKERPTPFLPMRIALVASQGTDGHRDFYKQLEDSGYGFDVTDFDVRVQGESLEPTVLAALARIAARPADFDVVVITRGGGGKGDLASWDNLLVARAVAHCPVKVLIAIGHENDATALDSIATSLPTPTAAGAFVVRRVADADSRAAVAFQTIVSQGVLLIEEQEELLQSANDSVVRTASKLVQSSEQLLLQAVREIRQRVDSRVRLASERLNQHAAAVGRATQKVDSSALAVEQLGLRLDRSVAHCLTQQARRERDAKQGLERAAKLAVERAEQALAAIEPIVRLADPANILRRGFALLRTESGAVLTSAAQVAAGQSVRIQLRDGNVSASVNEVETTRQVSQAEEQ